MLPGDYLDATPARQPVRKRYRAARAFYLVLGIGLLLALCAAYTRRDLGEDVRGAGALMKREVHKRISDEEQCRLVHRADDKCHFIRKHCPEDEGGFSAYLELYYCKLAHAKPVAFTILILWLGLLFTTLGIAASDFFCINLSTIASILGMSESMAGVTLLAFGNGSPDVFSTFAAMSTNSGSLAIGELIGAAGFITAVVAGSMALIKPFHVARKSFVRDVGFFIVAAAFSFSFLWDGRLQLWECIAMVIYYVCYVAFVVAWHWWIGRRRREREKQAAARGHFLPPGDELDVEEEYHDEPDSGESRPSRPGFSRGASREDFAALERNAGTQQEDDGDEDEEEEARDRWISELNSNMRVSRPPVRHARRNTIGPVRPSLVGALEFQAVLNSLQKSRNIQTIPLHTRRYSDDPTADDYEQDSHSVASDPSVRGVPKLTIDTSAAPADRAQGLEVPKSAPARGRAVSANAASRPNIPPNNRATLAGRRQADYEVQYNEHAGVVGFRSTRLDVPEPGRHSAPGTPLVEVSAPTPTFPITEEPESLEDPNGRRSPDHLSAADAEVVFRRSPDYFNSRPMLQAEPETPDRSPRAVPNAKMLPKIVIPRSRGSRESTPSSSPFPTYREPGSAMSSRPPSIYLPPPLASPESITASQSAEQAAPMRPIRWWPYKVLPPPDVLLATLFPTMCQWSEKSVWEKMIALVAAPSVFLLTITLPVVENDKDIEDNEETVQPGSYDSGRSHTLSEIPSNGAGKPKGSPRSSAHTPSASLGGALPSLAATAEQTYRHNYGTVDRDGIPIPNENQRLLEPSPEIVDGRLSPGSEGSQGPEHWNRWLTLMQLYLAPLFCILSIFDQSTSDISPRWLVLPVLISLLASTILLIPFLLTTTPTHRPATYRTLLSFAGFIVSIAWISTIASQVVGALKALAVICNMSHAIMGLTIFAVGNSLGDLVADVTVAKLGYPVMALSACFGGPMLNILLGIGISGTYVLVRGAQHHQLKHPGKGLKFKAYHIEVGHTLIVSGVMLLVTLVGLLIVVPMNKWVLSKRIGVALIVLWCITTVVNVIIELTGLGSGGSDE